MSSFRKLIIVLGAVLGLMVCNGPIMQFTFGVFILPVSEAFNVQRGTLSIALLLGLSMTGVFTPLAGILVDKYGSKKVAIPSIVAFSLCMAFLGWFASSAISFIVIYAAAGIFAAGQTPLPYAKVISTVFQNKRGLAMGIAMAGVGIGAAVMPQIAQKLLISIGWRQAYLGLSGLIFFLGLIGMGLFIKEPEKESIVNSKDLTIEVSIKESVKSRTFIYLVASFFLVALTTAGVIAHIIPLLTVRGADAKFAPLAISISGISLIIGRLISGYFVDKFFAPRIASIFFILPLFGLIALEMTNSVEFGLFAAVMVGLGLGAEIDLMGFMISKYFDVSKYGTLYGIAFAIFLLGSGLGPFSMGMAYQEFGTYSVAIYLFMISILIATALMLKLEPYKFD